MLRTGEPPQDQGPSDGDGGSGQPDARSSDAAGRPFEDIQLTGPPGVPSSRWSAPAGLNQMSSLEQIAFNRQSVSQGSVITACEVRNMRNDRRNQRSEESSYSPRKQHSV
ncbi:hypothetical protein C0J52_10932 [Blattella germanica]|nr:hypothetical protein C0J52_10932 [Blattella germanica]